MSSSVSSCSCCEKATITRSTSSALDELRQLLGRAEHGQVAEALLALARVLVDEADHVDPVLGVLQQLARDLLPDVAGADDERVLDVGVRTAAERPGDRARDD